MTNSFHLEHLAHGRMYASRFHAIDVRDQIDAMLSLGQEVTIDFAELEVGQGFADEIVGTMVMRHGPDVLDRIVLKGCTPSTREVFKIVVSDRIEQYLSKSAH